MLISIQPEDRQHVWPGSSSYFINPAEETKGSSTCSLSFELQLPFHSHFYPLTNKQPSSPLHRRTLQSTSYLAFLQFRPNWDVVSPFSWLDALADEEEFMRGFDKRRPSTRFVIFPHSRQRGREDEPMTEQAQEEEEEMETEDSPAAEEQKLMAGNFFDDLPAGAKLMDTQVPPNVAPPQSKTKEGYSFFTYSYSTCLTADDNGCRVNSTHRRYEDSAGRLKAQHKRQIGTCALESTWKRASELDEGTHDHKVSSGSVDGFEQAWKKTPFGVAEEQAKAHGAKQQSVLPDQPPAQELP